MFTRQHFRAIAEVVSKIEDYQARLAAYQATKALFAASNPRFKAQTYALACNMKEGDA